MIIVTDIIFIYSWTMHFQNVFDYIVWLLEKKQSFFFYLKYIVLYEQLNSPKEPNLVGVI